MRDSSGPRGSFREERGAALVEVALVMPLLVLLVLGMVEAGMAWRTSVTTTQASRQGARVASGLGDDYQADRQALLGVMSVLDVDQTVNVEYVVIYRADANGDLPAACAAASQPGLCNHYSAAMLQNLGDSSFWGTESLPCGGYEASWCPTSRSAGLNVSDSVGVHVSYGHTWFTGVMPTDGPTIRSKTVMQLEPDNT